MPSERDTMNWISNIMAGGVGGICVVLTGHPLDTLKVRIQTAPVGKAEVQVQSSIDCLKQIIAKEGYRGLYKGMGAPLVGATPLFALYFFGSSVARRFQQTHPDEVLNGWQNFYAGSFAGVLTTAVVAPAERIKCLLQVQHDKTDTKFAGPLEALRKLNRQLGIKGIYKGTAATLTRDVPASGLYFASYEFFMQYLTPPHKNRNDLSIAKTLFAGGVAGLCNWLIALPFDVLKSRLQTAPEGQYPRGMRDVAIKLVQEEGLKALYKGFWPVMIRAFLVNAVLVIRQDYSSDLILYTMKKSTQYKDFYHLHWCMDKSDQLMKHF